MPNDAKLGLLTGVIGVIVVAAMSVGQPPAPSPGPAAIPESAGAATIAPEVAPAARAAEPSSTPVIRRNREPDGTPAGRTAMDDIDQ